MTKFKLTAVLAAGAMAAALAPVAASAQPYYGSGPAYGYNNYAYDGCRRAQTGRTTAGALLGAAAGAALGNNVSRDRSTRHNSSAALGLLGAVVGGSVGRASAACAPGQMNTAYGAPPPAPVYRQAPAPYSYGQRGYDDFDDYEEYAGPPVPPPPARRELACQNVESPIYMPDGRQETRLVRVCPDSMGRYQIVD